MGIYHKGQGADFGVSLAELLDILAVKSE